MAAKEGDLHLPQVIEAVKFYLQNGLHGDLILHFAGKDAIRFTFAPNVHDLPTFRLLVRPDGAEAQKGRA